MTEIPITNHPKLPDGVPLVAGLHDMRNRLSYYYPILRDIQRVNTPITKFFSISGDYDSYPETEYREVTRFMQDQQMRNAFVRGDFSSAKFDSSGRRINSQDPYDIEGVVLEMMRQLGRAKRHLGGRIAVREWIPHEHEVRFFIRNGEVHYSASLSDLSSHKRPYKQAELVAEKFDTYAWSCDFIRHEKTGTWYCIDMGLDGLYKSRDGSWVAISEHLDEDNSPERFTDEMPTDLLR
jgi:hypothetical protein